MLSLLNHCHSVETKNYNSAPESDISHCLFAC